MAWRLASQWIEISATCTTSNVLLAIHAPAGSSVASGTLIGANGAAGSGATAQLIAWPTDAVLESRAVVSAAAAGAAQQLS